MPDREARRNVEPVNLFSRWMSLWTAPIERPAAMIMVDDAIQALEVYDARKARIIEMRFFGGMTAEESAEVLDIARRKSPWGVTHRSGMAEARIGQKECCSEIGCEMLHWLSLYSA